MAQKHRFAVLFVLAGAAVILYAADVKLLEKSHREVWRRQSDGRILKDFEWKVQPIISSEEGSLTVHLAESFTKHADNFAGVGGEIDFSEGAFQSLEITFSDGSLTTLRSGDAPFKGTGAGKKITKLVAHYELVGRKWALEWDARDTDSFKLGDSPLPSGSSQATNSQPPAPLLLAVQGDADTGLDTVSVIFLSGELQAANGRSLLLSFKIRVKTGANYTNGATEYFSTKHLRLHTPKGTIIETYTGNLYPERCSDSCTISYLIPRDEPGMYSIVNDYVGCCGTKQGQVTFAVPPWEMAGATEKWSQSDTSYTRGSGTALPPHPSEHRPSFSGQVRSLFANMEKIPSRIWLDTKKPSAMPGQQIGIEVSVVNVRNIRVPADRDVHVAVRASEGKVNPPEVTIPKGESAAVTSVLSFTPGQVAVNAAGGGLEGTERSVYYCGSGEIRGLDFNGVQQQALANGEKIPFTVVLTDGNGHPVTDNAPRNIAFDLQGVGQLQPKDGFVPPDQCAKAENTLSGDPGEAVIKASFGNWSQNRKFLFILPLSFMLFLLISCGGVGGAFVRAALTWSKSRRWSRSRWVAFLTSGALVGICVFLAYYYGFLRVAPQLLGGKGVGFLLGLAGGYLGQVATDRIADRIIPPSTERQAAKNVAT